MATYSSDRQYWTDYQDAIFREMWAEGATCTAIGKRLGKTKNSIASRRLRLGLPMRDHAINNRGRGRERLDQFAEYLSQGFTTPEIRLAMGINKDQASSLFHRIKQGLGWQAC